VISLTFDRNKFQSEISYKFDEFIGLSFEEISYKVSINPELVSTKASIVTIVNRMLEYKGLGKKQLANEVLPKQLSVKTIRLQTNGKPKESMSFERVNFVEMVEEAWSESKLRKKFAETIFLFVVFQYKQTIDGCTLLFKGVKLWQMPQETLDTEMKKLWDVTREIVSDGVKLKKKKVGNKIFIENNLPGKVDNDVAHIRPKARDGNDKVELPDGQMITKQAYWLNSNYIESILQDLPDVSWRKSNQPMNQSKFSIEDLNRLKAKLNEQVYPVGEFIIKAKQVIPGFTELDVNHNLISAIGFKLDNRFVITEQLANIDQYLYDAIFHGSYFQVPKSPVFVTPYVKRKIDNYENDYKLLKIEENLYITNTNLLNGGITKQDLISYKEAVERFIEDGQFFTLRSLEESQFSHELEEYGFEDIFYESILMRPGRLKCLKLANQIVFVKLKKDVTTNDLIAYLLADSESITVDDLIDRAQSMCHLFIDYDYAVRLMKNTAYFYSEDLLKLYEDKENYYKEIYK
jgi:DNA mismatch repair protein MutH